MNSIPKTRRRPRTPGAVFAALSATIFALIATVSLTAQSAPPPSVAEFAPVAPQQVLQKSNLAALGGQQPGGNGSGAATPTPTPTAAAGATTPTPSGPVVDTASVYHCIDGPGGPRQIEDPQSPPCVPYWKGDNGGATAPKGVTGSQITVVVGDDASSGAPLYSASDLQTYETFFNRRFEFYGRKLHLVSYTPAGPAASGVQMTTDAATVSDMNAFASVLYSEQDGRQYVYYDALAHHRVISVIDGLLGLPRVGESHMASLAPYEWDYTPSVDRMFRGYGQFLCNTLAHKPPSYGGPYSWGNPTERTFGIVVDAEYTDTPPFDVSPVADELKACGANPVVVKWDGSPAATLMATLQNDKVTSVMYTGQGGTMGVQLMPQATAQGYHPEWLTWDLGYQASDAQAVDYPKDQAAHVLGLQTYSKTLRPEDMPWWWAAKEVNPGWTNTGDQYMRLYEELLLIASGIQTAGPNLNPASFEHALMSTRFPNPGAGGAPYYQGTVGFPGVHSMVQDLTMDWLGATNVSPWTNEPPAYCYAQGGRRYPLGGWPKQDVQFFTGSCR